MKSWGEHGKGPGEFNTLHSIAADAQGNIYVGDRSNRRIQVFDGDGKFLREIKIDVPFDPRRASRRSATSRTSTNYLQTGGTFAPGAPWALCITPGPNQVLYSSDSYPGRIYKLSLDGKVLGYARRVGQAAQAVRLDPRDRLPVRERALRRRAPELARAEADPAPRTSRKAAVEGK